VSLRLLALLSFTPNPEEEQNQGSANLHSVKKNRLLQKINFLPADITSSLENGLLNDGG